MRFFFSDNILKSILLFTPKSTQKKKKKKKNQNIVWEQSTFTTSNSFYWYCACSYFIYLFIYLLWVFFKNSLIINKRIYLRPMSWACAYDVWKETDIYNQPLKQRMTHFLRYAFLGHYSALMTDETIKSHHRSKTFSSLKTNTDTVANSVDPSETARHEPSHRNLRYFNTILL